MFRDHSNDERLPGAVCQLAVPHQRANVPRGVRVSGRMVQVLRVIVEVVWVMVVMVVFSGICVPVFCCVTVFIIWKFEDAWRYAANVLAI